MVNTGGEMMAIFWTKYSPLESVISATDPIALDYMAQQLGYLPLPNFTTRTSRARYYSMVCYGLAICEEYINRHRLIFNDKTVMRLFELYEKYWAYAVVASYKGEMKERDPHESGLRGKRGALRAYNSTTKTLGEGYKLLSRQLELGGLGAYRSSLERFGLIKNYSLSLTMLGRELAEKFLPVGKNMGTQYQDMIIDSMYQERILDKNGRATIQNFGEYACLDYYQHINNDDGERELLRQIIIESDPATYATAMLALPLQGLWGESMLDFFEAVANTHPSDQSLANARDCFQTIYHFERLSTGLNTAFCTMVQSAFEQGDRITMHELESEIMPILSSIIDGALARQLIESPKYHEMTDYYYGTEYLTLISLLSTDISCGQFIRALLKLHQQVESKRGSGFWAEIEGDSIIVYSGYEYAQTNMNRQHSYKVDNLFSLIADVGWS